MRNDTPSTPPSGEQPEQVSFHEEESKAAEARLLELKHEVQGMLVAERRAVSGLPGWQLDRMPESITEEQATRLYSHWLDVQIRRHQERPDLYDRVSSHNGQRVKRMLAYVAEKKARLRDIRAEMSQIRDRHPSPRVEEEAVEIVSGCESLEEIYSETGNHYGRTVFPFRKKRGLSGGPAIVRRQS